MARLWGEQVGGGQGASRVAGRKHTKGMKGGWDGGRLKGTWVMKQVGVTLVRA